MAQLDRSPEAPRAAGGTVVGIDVGGIHTTSTMMDALSSAFASRGISLRDQATNGTSGA